MKYIVTAIPQKPNGSVLPSKLQFGCCAVDTFTLFVGRAGGGVTTAASNEAIRVSVSSVSTVSQKLIGDTSCDAAQQYFHTLQDIIIVAWYGEGTEIPNFAELLLPCRTAATRTKKTYMHPLKAQKFSIF